MPKRFLIALTILVICAVCLVVLGSSRAYVVRDSLSAGKLYWNAKEALVIIAEASDGADMTYARYELEPFLLSLGHIRQPSNKRCTQVLVIRLTDKGDQRYDTDLYKYSQDPYCGFDFDLFEGDVYAVAGPSLWKWSDTHFEPAPPRELGVFDATRAAKSNSKHPWKFDDIEGWSMRQFGQTPPKYELALNGQPVTLVFHGATWPPTPISVELIRTGENPQTIWSLDERPRRVTRTEYEHAFAQR
jgi:hypothetical protein